MGFGVDQSAKDGSFDRLDAGNHRRGSHGNYLLDLSLREGGTTEENLSFGALTDEVSSDSSRVGKENLLLQLEVR